MGGQVGGRWKPMRDADLTLISFCVCVAAGNCALLGGLDGVIRLLDRSTGEMLNHYKGCVCGRAETLTIRCTPTPILSNQAHSDHHPNRPQPRAQVLPRRVPLRQHGRLRLLGLGGRRPARVRPGGGRHRRHVRSGVSLGELGSTRRSCALGPSFCALTHTRTPFAYRAGRRSTRGRCARWPIIPRSLRSSRPATTAWGSSGSRGATIEWAAVGLGGRWIDRRHCIVYRS